MKSTFIVGAFVASAAATATAATITLSGFNQDLIAENDATSPNSGTSTNYSSYVFNERGAPTLPAGRGFPTDGVVTAANAGGTLGITFQLAPFDSGTANSLSNNALVVGLSDAPSTRQLTFSLAQQTPYSGLQFLTVNQGSSPGTSWNAIVVFSDSSTSTYTIASNRADWTSTPAAGVFRYNTAGLARRDANWGDVSGDALDYTGSIFLYEDRLTLSPADQLKTVVGVQFDVTSASGLGLVAFAISGTPVPEPSSALLLGLAGLVAAGRRHRR